MAHAILVNPPFAPLGMPSIGLTTLATMARSRGHAIDIRYPGFSLANLISTSLYTVLSNGYPTNTALAGDFLFSAVYYQKPPASVDAFVASHLTRPDNTRMFAASRPAFHEAFLSNYLRAFPLLSTWCSQIAQSIVQARPQLVGFSTMFQQTFSSLVIARQIKELAPDCMIVFGGPNVEDPMGTELLRGFSFINYVCSGEGEEAFLNLLESIDSCQAPEHRNLRRRTASPLEAVQSKVGIQQMTDLPIPDYDDFLDQSSELDNKGGVEFRVLLEMSRGCWWGAKAHCTFCGLNGNTMAFRSKPANQAFSEITTMQRKYPAIPISVVDNILDYKYFDTLLPMLIESGTTSDLFFETKANLTKQQLKVMRSAGIQRIQPGIESLSTSVLKLMKKGVSAGQNIALLRSCLEVGIKPEWNLLWGFPGEDQNEYRRMASLIPSLSHLPAPISSASLRLDRYSPLYEHSNPDEIQRVRPYPAYFNVYDAEAVSIDRIAYYFEFDYRDGQRPEHYTRELSQQCHVWKENWRKAFLFYLAIDENVIVADGRNPESVELIRFPAVAISLIEHCDRPRRTEEVAEWVDVASGSEMRRSYDEMIRRQILVKVDDYILSVASNLFDFPSDSEKVASFLQAMANRDVQSDQNQVTVRLPKSQYEDCMAAIN